MNKKNIIKKRGFALLIAIVTTGILLVVSFVVVNIALKQLILTYSNQESQSAFYVADSGVECAIYWDLKNPLQSAFATSTSGGSVTCNNNAKITTGSQTVAPSQLSVIGGGGVLKPTSIFLINFSNGCAIVQVTKMADGRTTINSRGYNTCDLNADRRFERGVTTTY